MKEAVIQDWVAALRSGRYKQCFGYLHSDSGYDALGVLCDLYDPDSWIVNTTNAKGETIYECRAAENDGSTFTLPFVVERWSGVDEHMQHKMIELSDKHRMPFTALANIIESMFNNEKD